MILLWKSKSTFLSCIHRFEKQIVQKHSHLLMLSWRSQM